MNDFDFYSIISIAPLSWTNIFACMVSGGLIGWERQILGKPVGIRTAILVCLGTYVFVTVGSLVTEQGSDPSRVLGQVVTGIGFLGAGVMMSKEGTVVGVTSAAAIWIIAAIGVLIGCDYPLIGFKLSLLTVLILVGVNYCEDSIKRLQRGVHRRLKFPKDSDQQLP